MKYVPLQVKMPPVMPLPPPPSAAAAQWAQHAYTASTQVRGQVEAMAAMAQQNTYPLVICGLISYSLPLNMLHRSS